MQYLDAYLRTQPLGIEPYEMKVDLLKRTQQTAAIVPWLEATSQRDRFNNALQLLCARELAAAKESKKAETVYKKLADDAPSSEVFRGLFTLYKDEGAAGTARVSPFSTRPWKRRAARMLRRRSTACSKPRA